MWLVGDVLRTIPLSPQRYELELWACTGSLDPKPPWLLETQWLPSKKQQKQLDKKAHPTEQCATCSRWRFLVWPLPVSVPVFTCDKAQVHSEAATHSDRGSRNTV
jgi:hypothetical protein